VDRFLSELPSGRFSRRLLPSILARVEARRALLAAVDRQWEEAFFGAARPAPTSRRCDGARRWL
jgi:hypothetical protein